LSRCGREPGRRGNRVRQRLSQTELDAGACAGTRNQESGIRSQESTMSNTEIYSPGLEGVIAGETAISTVEGGLRYRGYPVTELAEKASFEEVAYLLLHEELPNAGQLAEFQKRVSAARQIPEPLRTLLKGLPPATAPMDALRSAVSILAHFDPETADLSHAANVRKA